MKYNCRICGKEYETLEEVMDCEKKCYVELKRKEEIERQKKLNEEKEARRVEVEMAFKEANDMYNKAVNLAKKYNRDYHVSYFGGDFTHRLPSIVDWLLL